jgi:MscS family membrane protein
LNEFERGNPRSSLRGFFKASRDGDFERATNYFDLRNLPSWMEGIQGAELAR